MLAKLKGKRGFTLVELMIVVAIIGVLAALAIYGVRKYVANAKTAEARMTLGRIAKDASAAYNREMQQSGVLAAGGTAAITSALCGSASQVPTGDPPKAAKYQSAASDWQSGTASTGWTCLKFSMQDPQYYAYNYILADTANFTAVAYGDLDGDGSTSKFAIAGAIADQTVKLAPNVAETNPEE